ncbi:MAG: type II toxin-antitoxin system VapC family toxin [Alphaproteobacteria bacterium]|nr:type II toxin-antitoxin system VapC family toxin [Alphaproteobacteria bacterium]
MIVVDTSALIAILVREPGADPLRAALGRADGVLVAAPVALETSMVASRWGDAFAVQAVDGLFSLYRVEIVAFDQALFERARDAFLRYGRGRGHPARLNLCDCMSYALAVTRNAPLLFKGDDFTHTDVLRAI